MIARLANRISKGKLNTVRREEAIGREGNKQTKNTIVIWMLIFGSPSINQTGRRERTETVEELAVLRLDTPCPRPNVSHSLATSMDQEPSRTHAVPTLPSPNPNITTSTFASLPSLIVHPWAGCQTVSSAHMTDLEPRSPLASQGGTRAKTAVRNKDIFLKIT